MFGVMNASVWFVVFGVYLVVARMTHGVNDRDMKEDSEGNMTEMLVKEQQLKGVIDDRLLKMGLNSLMHNLQKHIHDPLVLHHPQRFGRGSRSDVRSDEKVHSWDWDSEPQQVWSLAVPQRFGKK